MYRFFKKSLVLIVPLLSLLSIQSAMAAGVHDNENPPCYDITGRTTQVLVPAGTGVNNGGIMNFDDAPSVLDPEYAACVRMSADPDTDPAAVPDHIEGWVWNTNLGWVSLYCDGGNNGPNGIPGDYDDVPNTNLGIACGPINYSVKFSVTPFSPSQAPDYDSVRLTGYAWGDNLGWLSFDDLNVSDFYQLGAVASGVDRGLVSGGVPAKNRYVWADSIGWSYWVGVHFYWENITPEVVEICPVKDQLTGKCKCNMAIDNCVYPDDVVPLADNIDSWDIAVNFVDESGNALNSSDMRRIVCPAVGYISMATLQPGAVPNKYAYCIEFVWSDSVSLDQTTKASQSDDFSADVGAVTKPTGVITVAADGTYSTKITSMAPTSQMNVSAMSKAGQQLNNERFFYYDTSALDKDDTGVNYNVKSAQVTSANSLKLESVKVLLFKYAVPPVGLNPAEPAICIVGSLTFAGARCNPISINPGNINFRPVIELTDLYQKAGSTKLDFLSLINRTAVEIPYSLVQHETTASIANLSVSALLGEMTAKLNGLGYQMGFVDNADTGFSRDEEGAITTVDSEKILSAEEYGSWFVLLDLLNSNNATTSKPEGIDPYIYTKISFNLNGTYVAYWGNKLPKQQAGLLRNPVAFVKGSVTGSVFTPGASDVSVNNLGTFYSNIARDRIHQAVSALIANKTLKKINGVTINNFANVDTGMTDLGNGVYYNKGDVIISCTGDCAPSSDVTIIVQDGSVVLKSNIKPINGAQLGIIVFDDVEDPLKANENKLGNLYVESAVTDILSTHIYLDGMLLSYKESYGLNPQGWPKFSDDVDRQQSLSNQLRVLGTVTSGNGFGNAYLAEPLDQNNLPVSGSTSYSGASPTGLALARTVDLNYLRYYGPGIELCDNGLVRDQQIDDLAAACNEANPARSINLSSLKSDGGDLIPGDGVGTKAEAYRSVSTLDAEYPVYFEFQPVSPNLKGFNQAVEIKY